MKATITLAILTLASTAFAYEGNHPGLPPASSSTNSNWSSSPTHYNEYSTERSVYEDVYSQGRWVNTKYGTAMMPEDIERAKENRRAAQDKTGGPAVGTPDVESSTY